MQFTQAIAVAILSYTAAAAPAGPTCVAKDSVCRSYTSNNGLSPVECDVAIAQCVGACQVSFDRCSVAEDANHATCVAQLVGCTGTSVGEALKPASAVGEALTQPAPTAKSGTPLVQGSCVEKDDHCRTAPGANMSLCNAEKAECKDTCSAEADKCRVAPGANQATCSADYAKCLGENPYAKREEPHFELGTPLVQGTCEQLDTLCRTAPGANMATCSAEQAACKGKCSSEADACRTAPGANQATCSADYAQCLGENPYAKRELPHFELGTPLVQGNCEQLDTVCRTAPGANMAQCSAEQAGCKAKCSNEADACRVAPGANQSLCSADYAKCLGTNPYN